MKSAMSIFDKLQSDDCDDLYDLLQLSYDDWKQYVPENIDDMLSFNESILFADDDGIIINDKNGNNRLERISDIVESYNDRLEHERLNDMGSLIDVAVAQICNFANSLNLQNSTKTSAVSHSVYIFIENENIHKTIRVSDHNNFNPVKKDTGHDICDLNVMYDEEERAIAFVKNNFNQK